MAWIPFTKELPKKRELFAIASATGRDRRQVVGLLLEFWAWADDETDDGHLLSMSLDHLPAIVEGTDRTFWLAVVQAGWLKEKKDGLEIPNFDRWMGNSSKSRLKKNRRQAKWREGREDDVDAPPSTKAPTTEQDKTGQDKTEQDRTEKLGGGPPKTPRAAEKPKNSEPLLGQEPISPDDRPKKTRQRDPLFDAVAKVTASDPTVSGSHIGRICKALRAAEPPYTPDEVLRWGELTKTWTYLKGPPTLGLLEKTIGQVRNPKGGNFDSPNTARRAAARYDPALDPCAGGSGEGIVSAGICDPPVAAGSNDRKNESWAGIGAGPNPPEIAGGPAAAGSNGQSSSSR